MVKGDTLPEPPGTEKVSIIFSSSMFFSTMLMMALSMGDSSEVDTDTISDLRTTPGKASSDVK
jgi:hypothetical protein